MSTDTTLTSAHGTSDGDKRRMTYTEFLDSSPMHKYLWLVVFGVALASLLEGFDFQITSFALPGIRHAFTLNPTQTGAVPAVGNFGLLFGALICSYVSDRIGRIKTLQWILFLFAFGSLWIT